MCSPFVCVLPLVLFPSRLSTFGWPENIVNWQISFDPFGQAYTCSAIDVQGIPNELFEKSPSPVQ
jgi:hypothetical protein